METTQLVKGVLDLAVLAVVAREDGYGYDVVRRIRAAGLEDVGEASVYGTLRRLFAAGADVKEMAEMSHTDMVKRSGSLISSLSAVARIPKPVVAAITAVQYVPDLLA